MREKGNKGELHSNGSTNIPVGCAPQEERETTETVLAGVLPGQKMQ